MKLAIVGGGWAGLSAAVTAVKMGYAVRLYESAAVLGGRARSAHVPTLDATIDNGQHILLGAYSATLNLMRELGLDLKQRFHRLPLTVLSPDAAVALRAFPGLPAPLHIAAGLLVAKGLSWSEKRAAIRAISGLRSRKWQVTPGLTVQEWLQQTDQPEALRRLLWQPLCIATLNTPTELACAQLFSHVLRDSVGASDRRASDMLIPRTGLTELWPSSVEAWAATMGGGRLEVVPSHTVRAIGMLADQRLSLDDDSTSYDAVLVCGNTPSTARLLATLPPCAGSDDLLETLNAFEHAPIATLTVELKHAIRLRAPMLLLQEDRERDHYGQWLFQGQDHDQRLLHVVVSDADALLKRPRPQAVAGMLSQLHEQLSHLPMPPVARHALIVEKRATFLAVPGLKRPRHRTPWPGVWLAGDWTDTGYPAVLEGAVRSGRDAVLALHSSGSSA